MREGTESLGIKLWETPPGKVLRLPEVLPRVGKIQNESWRKGFTNTS